MIKSALRFAKFSGLPKSVLTDGQLTLMFTRLSVITSRNVCTTQVCGKEVRMQNKKVKIGQKSKYGLTEGEIMPETINISQQ